MIFGEIGEYGIFRPLCKINRVFCLLAKTINLIYNYFFSESEETIEEIRNRLKGMRQLMEDRQAKSDFHGDKRTSPSAIDASFLSAVFCITLVVIITVSIYAFYNLTTAILKKFPHTHEEL